MNALLRPGTKALYLTVIFGNEPALRVYLRENFKALDKPYLGGASGPQHVMMKEIEDGQRSRDTFNKYFSEIQRH